MAHPVMWFQIQGEEGKALRAFYKNVFSWRVSAGRGSPMALVEAEEGGIAGGIGESGDGIASVAVYIGVDDLAAQLAKIEKAGGRTSLRPTKLPGEMGSIAGFIDPAGNWIGLWQKAKLPKAATGQPKKKKKNAKSTAPR